MADAMQKDEVCKDCYYEERSYTVAPCNECSRAFSGRQKDWYTEDGVVDWAGVNPTEVDDGGSIIIPDSRTEDEKYLTQLIDDHWAYIEGLLEAHDIDSDIIRASEFHYKSAGRHFWKHALEYVGQVS